MAARDDYDALGWHAERHDKTNLGEQCLRALEEIDRLRALEVVFLNLIERALITGEPIRIDV